MTQKRLLLQLLIVVSALVFFSGPKIKVTPQLSDISLPSQIDKIPSYLDQQENRFSDIKPNTEKRVAWAKGSAQKTPLAIVYVHGFSASRQDTAPMAKKVAKQLNANLFETRLTGHGRSNDAMAEATLNLWLDDVNEAIEIGSLIGHKVILMGVSTGSSLAVWFAANQDRRVEAYILMSPNFGPADPTSEVMTWPWGMQIAQLVEGQERCFNPQNDLHQFFWTSCYPTEALKPMMAAVMLARESSLSKINQPVMMLYSPGDQVINTSKLKKAFDNMGSSSKALVAVTESNDKGQHMLAGDILSPDTTDEIVAKIVDFVLKNTAE